MIVRLQWDRNTDLVAGYNVYRGSHSSGPYIKINANVVAQPPEGTSPTYTDSPADSTYFYVVRAMNTAGESPNSNEVMAQPTVLPPKAPTGLTASVETSVSLAVDAQQVASAAGVPPFALNYHMPRQTPPREHQLTVRVA